MQQLQCNALKKIKMHVIKATASLNVTIGFIHSQQHLALKQHQYLTALCYCFHLHHFMELLPKMSILIKIALH